MCVRQHGNSRFDWGSRAAAFCAALFFLAASAESGEETLLPSDTVGAYAVRRWTLDDGLPDSLVCGVASGRDGYVWLATARYLVRFDGLSFVPIAAPVSTGRNEGLFQDSDAGLWLYGSFGAVRYRGGGWWQPGENAHGALSGRVYSVTEGKGRVLFFAQESAVYEWRDGVVRLVLARSAFPNETGRFRQLVWGDDGGLWLVVGNGLYRWFPGGAAQPVRMTGLRADWVLSAASGRPVVAYGAGICLRRRGDRWERLPDVRAVSARCVQEMQDGALWVGHDAGVDVFCGNAWHMQTHVAQRSPLQVLGIAADRENNSWLATADGLVRLRRRVMQNVFARTESGHSDVSALWAESGGRVWAVLRSGILSAGDAGGLDPLLVPPGFSDVSPNALYRESNGTLWCGCSGGFLWSLQNQSLQRTEGAYADDVRAMAGRGGAPLWVATRRGVLALDVERNVLKETDWPHDPVLSLWLDPNGTLWVGHESLGLAVRQPGGKIVFAEESAVPGRTVRALYRDRDGILWIGGSEGLARWEGERRFVFRRSHGLWSESVRQIAEDGIGYLWLGTADGIERIAKQDLADVASGRKNVLPVRTFGAESGMDNTSCVGGVFFPNGEPPGDRLWFPTLGGLVTVETRLLPPIRPAPVIRLTALELGRRVELCSPPDSGVAVGRRGNAVDPRDVGIAFTALDFSTPERVRFRYELSGPVRQQSGLTEERRAVFSRLPPGDYVFRVTACNGDGVWQSSGATVAWTVRPFFWETVWFRIGCLILGVGIVGLVVRAWERRRVRRRLDAAKREQGLARERARIARDLHDEIGAKLTRLTLLGAMAAEDAKDDEPLRREVSEMADTARETHRAFDEIVWSVSPRNDTVRSLSHYICKYAEEFFAGTDVLCHCRLPDELADRPIDPQNRHQMFLAVKESLHNVLKHAGAKRVRLEIGLTDGRLRVEVDDDGGGFDPVAAGSQGDGLRNMQERMKAVGGKLVIESGAGKGTRLVFDMPV